MVAFPKSLCLLLALFIATTGTHAYFDITVGGTKGWTVNPTEDYDIWAARMRFSINDTIHFSYNKATDSVLVVSRDDYDKCDTNKPITILGGGGDSSFTLDRSGAFYFITGNKTNCDEGLKMHLIVLAIRNTNTKPQPPSPSPTISSPATGVAAPNNDNVSTALPPLAQASAAAAASTISFLMITLALFFSAQLY